MAIGTPQSVSTADAILKDLYVGPIVEQLNYKTYMLDQIERDSDHIDHTGRRAVIPVHSGRNLGRGSRGDGGTLPTAGQQAWADAIVNIRYHYYGIEVTDGAIEASQSNEGAFISILDAETKGVARDMRKDINRQVFGFGASGTQTAAEASGYLASVAATSTTTDTIVLNSVQYIAVGDVVDVLRRTDGGAVPTTAGAGKTVSSRVGGQTKTITLNTAIGGTIGTEFGVYIASNRGQEMDGLRWICKTDRTLHSINSATAGNEYWDVGSEKDASNAVAGESLFEQVADDVGLTGNGEVETFLTSRGIRRRLADTYQSQKRFNDARAVEVHGGYSAIMVNEIPVVADDDCPRVGQSGTNTASVGYVFGINKSSFKWFEQTSPGWLEHGGGIFHLKDGSSAGTKVATWQAWFRWYAALGCVAPQRNGVIINCADDNPA